jgi:alkanesulfonate monooxygenase SsuD/methylene tetrahydromethanopterin reductase-like flavin-dependent oxidoreductase (luciferase family)
MPLSHPLRIAEAVATVDQLSHGRLDFGGGRSANTESYRRSDVSYLESKERQEEALEIIKKAWTTDRFSHRGKFYNFPDVALSPKPYQKPHPPIYMAVVSPYSFPWAGRMGYDIFINPRGNRAELLKSFQEYRQAWRKAGHPGEGRIVGSFLVYVADTETKAQSEPREGTMELFKFQARLAAPLAGLNEEANQSRSQMAHYLTNASYEQVLREDVIIHYGTPNTVAQSLQELRDDLGLDGFMLDMNCYNRLTPKLTINSMQLFSEEVIPQLK